MSNFYTEPFVSAGEMEFPSQPYITAQPQNHTATGVEDYVLTVIAVGAVSYQWEVFDGMSWSTIPGATSKNLAITIDPSMNGWRYRVIVTGADGSTVVSKAAQIAVRGVHEITLEGAIVTFTGPARIKSLEVEINPVQSGNGDPSPTNIRPISGWNAVNVFVRGTNQWDEEWEVGAYSAAGVPSGVTDGIRSANMIPVLPNTAYYFSTGSTAYFMTKLFFDADRNPLQTTPGQYQGNSNALFTTPNNAHFMLWYGAGAYGTTYNNDISINYPSTDHSYHPYNGTTYPISLGQTVYGGVLDVTNGVLTVTHYMQTAPTTGWEALTSPTRYRIAVPRPYSPATGYNTTIKSICNMCKMTTTKAYSTDYDNGEGGWYNVTGNFAIRCDEITTLADWETLLAVTPLTLCYELATPTTIQLTPTEVTTLLGVNNIWADSGDVAVTIIR